MDIEKSLDLNYYPYKIIDGKRILSKSEDNDVYAGPWIYQLINETDSNEVLIGYYTDPTSGDYSPAKIPFNSLFRHISMNGLTGYGKTNHIISILTQILQRNNTGLTFIDPKGNDGYTKLLQRVPKNRLDNINVLSTNIESTDGMNLLKPYYSRNHRLYNEETVALTETVISLLFGMNSSDISDELKQSVRAIIEASIQSSETVTLTDIHEKVSSDNPSQSLAEIIGKELSNSEMTELMRLEESEWRTFERSLNLFSTNPKLEHYISDKNGKSPFKMLEQDEITVVNAQSVSDEVRNRIGELFTEIMYGYTKFRVNNKGGQTPHFFAIDELDCVIAKESNLPKLISRARAARIGVICAYQSDFSLPERISQSVLGNTANIHIFNPGNQKGADVLGQVHRTGAKKLLDLEPYEFVSKLYINDSAKRTDPFVITSIPPLRPLRTKESVRKSIIPSR